MDLQSKSYFMRAFGARFRMHDGASVFCFIVACLQKFNLQSGNIVL